VNKNNADIKPSLIDLEADNTATGRKDISTDIYQRERLSEKDNVYILYWIRRKEHTDMFKEGYIGITCDFKERMRNHRKNKNKTILTDAISSIGWENLNKDIIYDGLTLSEILNLEFKYRPSENIGWNLQKGGNLGVDSSWYKLESNRTKHSKNTSKGTKLGIKKKDSKKARSKRAKISRIINKDSYIDKNLGSKNPKAKLNESQVYNIKFNLIPNSFTNKQIAELYNVKPYVIQFIRSGKTWKHVICDSPDYK
jgi:hypothetical protein